MEALVRLEAPSMVWAQDQGTAIQAVMEKLQQRRLSISGRRRDTASATVSSTMQGVAEIVNQLDVPWETRKPIEEPEQDEKSLNETILQTKKPRDGDRPSAGRWCTHRCRRRGCSPRRDRGTHGDDKTRIFLGHWTTNCPTIECFKMPTRRVTWRRACPESEDNVERKDIACQVCGQRGVTVPECGRCSYLFDRSGNEQVEARGSVAVPLKSHTRPKESDRADDALIRWLYRLEQQDKLKVLRWERYLHIASGPRDDTLIPMPGGGTISEWCLRDLSAAGERPAGQADEGIEKIAEPCETRKQNAWSQGEFVTLELGGEAEESTQKKNRMRRGDKARPREDSLLDVTSKGRSRKTLRSVSTVENDRVFLRWKRGSVVRSRLGVKKSPLNQGRIVPGVQSLETRLAKTLRVEVLHLRRRVVQYAGAKLSRWYQESITATKKRVLGLRIHGDAERLQCLMSRMEPTVGPEEGGHCHDDCRHTRAERVGAAWVRLDLLYTWISQR
ncbi:unnamed protein product [Trichogramma brassicae]|uniref:Uncharacterized protein n=1 Tax=Trichogramma brassicae TaxID=86971 RepID=A0A6H5I0B3_9HYME|nr:unnamed protein product [Trichogramma brassicae]